jgi:pimeloyl-ACP methyl ester carboxylesterase
MGGIVAQQLAADAPDRVRRLLLVATTPGLGGVSGDMLSMLNIAAPVRYLSSRLYAKTIGGLAGGRARHDREWVEEISRSRVAHAPSLRGYTNQMLSLSTWSGFPLLEGIDRPTLVIAGDDDPLAPVANSLLLAHLLPRGRLLVVPGEGHLMLTDPDSAVHAPIRSFLGAPSLAREPVWRHATIVEDWAVRDALATTKRQVQPWGVIGGRVRRKWLVSREGTALAVSAEELDVA